jgi:hypothetical protein
MSLIVQDFQRRDQRVAPQDPEVLLTLASLPQSLSAPELARRLYRQVMPK